MKVYLVYDGYYSQFRRVFTTEKVAEEYVEQLACPEDNAVVELDVEEEISPEGCPSCGRAEVPNAAWAARQLLIDSGVQVDGPDLN